MYRRRRSQREKIFFSFDSFLDVVANVIGIIIRLILVAWVGARSYTAAMQFTDAEPEPTAAQAASVTLPAPKLSDDPLASKLDLAKQELMETRNQLLDKLQNLQGAKEKTRLTRAQVAELARKNAEVEQAQRRLEKELEAKGQKVQRASLSLDALRRRGQELADQVMKLQALPAPTKQLKYHAPVSRAVSGDEVFFECRGGRVAFIDMPAFMHEIHDHMDDIPDLLRKEAKVRRLTSPVGAFRLQYVFEREQTLLDSSTNFSYGMSGWVVEPILFKRGESLAEALKPQSDFHRIADAIDPNQAVVTFWVYPDSFEIFRALRDYLYERDVEVAGRPLPMNGPIAASRHGTKSRGQ
jgi:hypothetical protein